VNIGLKKKYRAYEISEISKNIYQGRVVLKNIDALPKNDTLIKVYYSSLNFKDALSATGNKGVTKKYPHTPGIDAAGIVVKSNNDKFKEGTSVIVTGYDLGMNTPGGLGEYVSVPDEWIVKLPDRMSLEESMIYGTAGLTATLSVMRLIEEKVDPSGGEVVVTGSSGGLGSACIAILKKAGFIVTAVTGKDNFKESLMALGADSVISRDEVDDKSGKLLLPARWIAAIDTAGGNILSSITRSTKKYGCVVSCGNVASYELNTNVFPFILRGITLAGIDSAECSHHTRSIAWGKLASEWNVISLLKSVNRFITLDEAGHYLELMMRGKSCGHIVVKHNISN
jgi:putative YhdH/YhfP family quinone oxidoreductase